ncbi:MAG: ABC transporter permease, partial [Gammaproteobacteria bacterium]
MRLVTLANLNHLRRHPWQLGLAVFGITLGVAIVVAVQITQRSAKAAFEAAQQTFAGVATHRIEGLHNAPIDEMFFARLRKKLPEVSATPVLEADIALTDAPDHWLQLYGFDLLNPLQALDTDAGPGLGMLSEARGVVSARTWQQLPLRAGRRLALGTHAAELAVTPLTLHAAAAGLDNVILVDIATAQELLQREGQLSYIDLRLDPLRSSDLARQIARMLPPELRLRDITREITDQQSLTKAFDTNLVALSLLGLLVGMFLVYNTQSFLVVQRRTMYVQMRTLGVTTRELLLSVLFEALVVGVTASALGVVLGIAIADVTLDLVTRTRRDFYYAVSTQDLALPSMTIAACFGAGITTTLAAALRPAIEAARAPLTDSSSGADGSYRRPSAQLLLLIVALLVAVLSLPMPQLWRDFTVLFLALAAIGLGVPTCFTFAACSLRGALRRAGQWPERLGIATALRSRQRIDTAT